MENIIERLKKVKELAERGIEGERETAQLLLDQLLIKYKISPEMISTDIREEFRINYKSNIEKKLIIQIIASVAGNVDIYISRGRRPILMVQLTKMETLLIDQMIHFHLVQYRKELKKIIANSFIAYIHKHDIFSEIKDEDDLPNKKEIDPQIDMRQIIAMIDQMENKTFRRALN